MTFSDFKRPFGETAAESQAGDKTANMAMARMVINARSDLIFLTPFKLPERDFLTFIQNFNDERFFLFLSWAKHLFGLYLQASF